MFSDTHIEAGQKIETAHVSLTQLRVPVTSLENNKTIIQHHSTRLILGYFVQLPCVYSFTRQKTNSTFSSPGQPYCLYLFIKPDCPWLVQLQLLLPMQLKPFYQLCLC